MSVLGLIPARGGSKGIPRKNIKLLGGKPLIQWTIEAARASGVIDRLVVSTEDAEIAAVADGLGVEALNRPPALARDNTPMAAVVWHAIGVYEPEIVVILQPTTPFRSGTHLTHLQSAVECVAYGEYQSAVSVIDVPTKYSPEWAWSMSQFERPPQGPLSRQAQRCYFVRDGSFYVFQTVEFASQGTVFPERCRTMRVERTPNLDEPEDWAEAERRVASMLVTA